MARFTPGGQRPEPHDRHGSKSLQMMALLALHHFVCSGEGEGTLAGMVKRQDAPAGRLVASAAVRPPAGGELRVV